MGAISNENECRYQITAEYFEDEAKFNEPSGVVGATKRQVEVSHHNVIKEIDALHDLAGDNQSDLHITVELVEVEDPSPTIEAGQGALDLQHTPIAA